MFEDESIRIFLTIAIFTLIKSRVITIQNDHKGYKLCSHEQTGYFLIMLWIHIRPD